MEHHISDWDAISSQFSTMFQGLGEVKVTEEHLSYSSKKPHVATSLMLTRDGQLVASMPLHTIDSRFAIGHSFFGAFSIFIYRIRCQAERAAEGVVDLFGLWCHS